MTNCVSGIAFQVFEEGNRIVQTHQSAFLEANDAVFVDSELFKAIVGDDSQQNVFWGLKTGIFRSR
jgi:hypothetical protein